MVAIVIVIITIAVSVGLGFLTDYLGKQKGRSNCFWFGFLLGIIGIIIVLCLDDKTGDDNKYTSSNKYEDLEKLQKLKESGALTEIEFEVEKQKLLR